MDFEQEKRGIILSALNKSGLKEIIDIPHEYSIFYDLIYSFTSLSVSVKHTTSLTKDIKELSFLGDEAVYFAAALGDVDQFCKIHNIFSTSDKIICDSLFSAILDFQVKSYIDLLYGEEFKLFCPGYNGTSVKLNSEIVKQLGWRTSLRVLDTGGLFPQKSVCGVLIKGLKFSCKGCILIKECKYLKNKTKCYES